MASIKRHKEGWRAQLCVNGKRASQTFRTKAEAQGWALQKEHEFGKKGADLPSKTLRDAMERYKKDISPGKKGRRWEEVRINSFMREGIADIQLADLATEDIQKWIDERLQSVKSSTVNRELNLLSAVLSTTRKRWKWLEHHPMQDIQRPKDPAPRDRRIGQQEIDRILLALRYQEDKPPTTFRQQIAVAFLLALETAMRQGELWGLRWEHVHLKERYVYLPDTKNGTARDVPLSERAVQLFEKMERLKSTEVVFSGNQESMGVLFRRAVQMAGIENLTFHDSRHEATTRLARKLDVLDLARMTGHKDTRNLMIYYNPTASEIAKRLG